MTTTSNTTRTYVSLDASKFVFKGNDSRTEAYKSNVIANQNEIGYILYQTFGTIAIKFTNTTIVVPKSWVIIF